MARSTRTYVATLTQTRHKIKYAKWKAAQISKALREGLKPAPGPANAEEDEVLAQLVTPVQIGEGAGSEQGANAQDTAAEGTDAADARTRDVSPSDATSPPSPPPADRAPTLPPPPTSDLGTPSAPTAPSPVVSAPQLPTVPQDDARSPPVHVIAPSAPPAPSPAPAAPPARTVHVAPSAPPRADERECALSVMEIAKVQKLSRWASSALDYEDVDTARTHLRDALRILDVAQGDPRV